MSLYQASLNKMVDESGFFLCSKYLSSHLELDRSLFNLFLTSLVVLLDRLDAHSPWSAVCQVWFKWKTKCR